MIIIIIIIIQWIPNLRTFLFWTRDPAWSWFLVPGDDPHWHPRLRSDPENQPSDLPGLEAANVLRSVCGPSTLPDLSFTWLDSHDTMVLARPFGRSALSQGICWSWYIWTPYVNTQHEDQPVPQGCWLIYRSMCHIVSIVGKDGRSEPGWTWS